MLWRIDFSYPNSRGNGIHSETKKASRKVTNNDWYHWKAQGPYFTLVLFKVVEFMDLMVKMASAWRHRFQPTISLKIYMIWIISYSTLLHRKKFPYILLWASMHGLFISARLYFGDWRKWPLQEHSSRHHKTGKSKQKIKNVYQNVWSS